MHAVKLRPDELLLEPVRSDWLLLCRLRPSGLPNPDEPVNRRHPTSSATSKSISTNMLSKGKHEAIWIKFWIQDICTKNRTLVIPSKSEGWFLFNSFHVSFETGVYDSFLHLCFSKFNLGPSSILNQTILLRKKGFQTGRLVAQCSLFLHKFPVKIFQLWNPKTVRRLLPWIKNHHFNYILILLSISIQTSQYCYYLYLYFYLTFEHRIFSEEGVLPHQEILKYILQ